MLTLCGLIVGSGRWWRELRYADEAIETLEDLRRARKAEHNLDEIDDIVEDLPHPGLDADDINILKKRKPEPTNRQLGPKDLEERPTSVYELKKDGETVYIGETCRPKQRPKEHRRLGKDFDHAEYEKGLPNKREAKLRQLREREKLKDFRHRNGKNPKYNRTNHG